MSHTPSLSRREFLKILGMTASAATLQACTSQIPVQESPVETREPVQPTAEGSQAKLATATATEKPVVEAIYPEMVLVEAGSFQMGSIEGYSHEQPVHNVTLTKPFNIGIYAVTYEEYDRYCENTQKSYLDDRDQGRGTRPISGEDWYDAVAY